HTRLDRQSATTPAPHPAPWPRGPRSLAQPPTACQRVRAGLAATPPCDPSRRRHGAAAVAPAPDTIPDARPAKLGWHAGTPRRKPRRLPLPPGFRPGAPPPWLADSFAADQAICWPVLAQ